MADLPARIAITGASGFLGRYTVERLAARPGIERVLAIDVQAPAHTPDADGAVVHVTRDVREPLDDLLAEHSIQAVCHLAYVVRPARDRSWARSINVEATESLLRACSAAGVSRVVYLSSATVYGARRGNSRPFTEEDPPAPVRGFGYSEDKVAAESLLTAWQKETLGASATVLRGCVVMGPAADNFIIQALTMRWLPLPAFEDAELQFLHVSDQVDALERALSDSAGGVYNVAGSGTVRWRQMVRLFGNRSLPVPGPLLQALTGLTWSLRLQSRSPAAGVNFVRYPWLVATDKIERELGWSPAHTSEQALLAARGPAP